MNSNPRTNYDRILEEFGADNKPASAGIKHLESLGFTHGQARNAVYQYRRKKGLVRPAKPNEPF